MRAPRAAIVFAAFAVGATFAVSCRDPTEVRLQVTSDQPCSAMDGITIATGTLADLKATAWSTASRTCTDSAAGGSFGDIVLVPSGSKDGPLAIQVTAGVGVPVESCAEKAEFRAPGTGCIVARRSLAFVPHTPLYLPVVMRKSCIDVDCRPEETCTRGVCTSAVVSSPRDCATPGACGEPIVDGGPVDQDATIDGPIADAPVQDVISDRIVVDATPTDGGPCTRGPSPGSGCHSPTGGTQCTYIGDAAPITNCPTVTDVCCANDFATSCRTACSGGSNAEYQFACDEPQDCAPGEYCVGDDGAGPSAGAKCRPASQSCTGARLCKQSCDCDADEVCRQVVCPATIGVTTIHVQLHTCGGVCP